MGGAAAAGVGPALAPFGVNKLSNTLARKPAKSVARQPSRRARATAGRASFLFGTISQILCNKAKPKRVFLFGMSRAALFASRDVLVLRHLEGLPFAEVARRMGRSPGAVRVLWLRALELLRQQPRSEDPS
jgi:hypothetical protein